MFAICRGECSDGYILVILRCYVLRLNAITVVHTSRTSLPCQGQHLTASILARNHLLNRLQPPLRVLCSKHRGGKIIAAAWNADSYNLALATDSGGVDIYGLLPTHRCNVTSGTAARKSVRVGAAVLALPANLVLRHKIIVNCTSSEVPVPVCIGGGDDGKNCSVGGNGIRTVSRSQLTCLASDESDGNRGGAAMLVGVAEGRHLYVWDMLTGSTLLTALALAPDGCNVEKVAWHAPAALVALVYSVENGARRVDVHQLNISEQRTTQVRTAQNY